MIKTYVLIYTITGYLSFIYLLLPSYWQNPSFVQLACLLCTVMEGKEDSPIQWVVEKGLRVTPPFVSDRLKSVHETQLRPLRLLRRNTSHLWAKAGKESKQNKSLLCCILHQDANKTLGALHTSVQLLSHDEREREHTWIIYQLESITLLKWFSYKDSSFKWIGI